MLIEIISFIVLTIIMSVFINLNYKKCETCGEKILFVLYAIICIIPIFIYYLDLWNIPSSLNLVKNINSQNWLAFLANYTSSIVSAIIGATVSIGLVFLQIRKNNEDTEKRDKESLRIQNMPLLKYYISTDKEVSAELENCIFTKKDDAILYPLNIAIKNIGMNAIRSLKVDFESEIDSDIFRLVGEKSQVPIERDEIIYINKCLNLPCIDNEYKIKLKVLYEDILTNWYIQEVEINYITTNICEQGRYKCFVKFVVKEENKKVI